MATNHIQLEVKRPLPPKSSPIYQKTQSKVMKVFKLWDQIKQLSSSFMNKQEKEK